MNYSEIKALALSYADRSDTETSDKVDDFLRIVESKVNRYLKTMEMSELDQSAVVADQAEYTLPSDYNGARQIRHTYNGKYNTISLVTPEQYDRAASVPDTYQPPAGEDAEIKGYVDDGKLFIYPAQDTGTIDLLYYKKVPALSDSQTTNWLGDDYPDCYIFGLCVEILAFVKDYDTAAKWEQRFEKALGEIKIVDVLNRWTGPPLQIRTE